ncbi:MAG TPA: SpoIIE family protein phosphatase [Frankiaceae bacterium]|nr:SpoIIE family protein phosphatase [Frankiaceae bacterium]
MTAGFADESARLAAVRRYDILDTPPDGAFDRITALAARLFDVPIAIVSVVDTDRIWFKSRYGLDGVEEVGRVPGLCASAILQSEDWVVNDASVDPRTLANPLVAGELGLRFYAGVPLRTADGHNLGTLCVIDREPREVTERQMALLRDLAALVVESLEIRLDAIAKVRETEELAGALQASLLPPRPPELPGMELATRYEAVGKLVVGGDFYDVFRLAANDWAIVVGDVCGHGARAAAITGLARWTLRAAAVHHFEPSATLTELNAAMHAAAPDDDDSSFATVALARLELDVCGAWLTLCCAGHPRPIVVRKAGWIDVRGQGGTPVGMFEAPSFADDRVGLGPGDALVFFTDGITEARGAVGEMFADEALPTALLEAAGGTAEEIADRVLDALRAYAPGPPHDDRALVVVRVPDDAKDDSVRRVSAATGIPPEELVAPRYPVGEAPVRRRPAPPREARIRLDGEPSSVGAVRGFLRRVLASWRMDELLADGTVELLASELATNALFHGISPVTVIARYDGNAVRVEVGDGSRELPAPRDALLTDEGGRGLHLVAELSSDWGTLATLDGKRVWFEVPAAPA